MDNANDDTPPSAEDPVRSRIAALLGAQSELQGRCDLLARELSTAYSLLEERGLWGIPFRAVWIAAADLRLPAAAEAVHHVDRLEVRGDDLVFEGWAFSPANHRFPEVSLAVLVEAPPGGWLMFPTKPAPRPDVAAFFSASMADVSGLDRSGFSCALPLGLWTDRQARFRVVVRDDASILATTAPLTHRLA
jgi:hypothetical protein